MGQEEQKTAAKFSTNNLFWLTKHSIIHKKYWSTFMAGFETMIQRFR